MTARVRGEEWGGGINLPYTIPLMVTDVSAMFVATTTCTNNLTVKAVRAEKEARY